MTSDDELMRRVREGSGEAFETLFERYRGPVWQFFRRRTPNAAVAQELAQDTFVAVLDARRRYTQRERFRAWLFGIAYHVLMADRRKRVRRSTEPLLDDPPNPGSGDIDEGIWVRNAIASLDENEREILMLREYEQLSYDEIADVRGVPVNTVRSQLFRARAALKQALEPQAAPSATRTIHGR